MDAAKAPAFDVDIDSMLTKMHTPILEGVENLSGGQRQRLLIERALELYRANGLFARLIARQMT